MQSAMKRMRGMIPPGGGWSSWDEYGGTGPGKVRLVGAVIAGMVVGGRGSLVRLVGEKDEM